MYSSIVCRFFDTADLTDDLSMTLLYDISDLFRSAFLLSFYFFYFLTATSFFSTNSMLRPLLSLFFGFLSFLFFLGTETMSISDFYKLSVSRSFSDLEE